MTTIKQITAKTVTACKAIGDGYGKLSTNLKLAILRAIDDEAPDALNAVLATMLGHPSLNDKRDVVRGAAMYLAHASGCEMEIGDNSVTLVGTPEFQDSWEMSSDKLCYQRVTDGKLIHVEWYSIVSAIEADRAAAKEKARAAKRATSTKATPAEKVAKCAKSVKGDDPLLAKVLESIALMSPAQLANLLGDNVTPMPAPEADDVAKSA